MILIAHRGNISGKDPARENEPGYVKDALQKGYNVEVDVWRQNNVFFLGHSCPQYPIDEKFLENNRLWCHAKNLSALDHMSKNKYVHCFWAEHDHFPLTSRAIIWTEPGKDVSPNSIFVLPELSGITDKTKLPPCLGVCSDHIAAFV